MSDYTPNPKYKTMSQAEFDEMNKQFAEFSESLKRMKKQVEGVEANAAQRIGQAQAAVHQKTQELGIFQNLTASHNDLFKGVARYGTDFRRMTFWFVDYMYSHGGPIDNNYKQLHRTRIPIWVWPLLIVVGIPSVVFLLRPELGLGFGNWVNTGNNAYVLLGVAFFLFLAVFLIVRRKRKEPS